MAYYKLIREKCPVIATSKSDKAVRGTLYEVHTSGLRETLVPICPTLENADKMIPALIYRVAVTQSPKFHRLLPLLNQVPGRTGIRVHRGTKPQHSSGCILVSAADEQLLTAKWLNEQKENEEIRLEFC